MFKKLSALLLAVILMSSVAFAKDFTDFDSSHWASWYVNALVSEGTINGYDDGSFKPSGTVTRAEFVKMIGKSAVRFSNDFNDVASEHWAYDYIMYSGLDGDSNNNFNPNVAITRKDVLILLWKRAGSVKGVYAHANITDQCPENPDAAAWGNTYGIMIGDDGVNLRLNDTMSRAEGAALIIRSRDYNATQSGFEAGTKARELEDAFNDAKLVSVLGDYAAPTMSPRQLLYSQDAIMTNGQLAAAAIRLLGDTYELSYTGLNASAIFDEDIFLTPSLYVAARDVIGADKATKGLYYQKANVKDALSILTYFAVMANGGASAFEGKNDYYKIEIPGELSENENLALTFAYKHKILLDESGAFDPNKLLTHKDFAEIISRLNEIFGMFNKYEITAGEYDKSIKTVKTALTFKSSDYPSNKSSYQAIVKEIPKNVYEENVSFSGASTPKAEFDFLRELYPAPSAVKGLKLLNDVANAAKDNGVSVKFTYYPILGYHNGENKVSGAKSVTLRLKCEISDAKSGAKLNDICKTSVNKSLEKGMVFFIDYKNNEDLSLKNEITSSTIDKLIEIK